MMTSFQPMSSTSMPLSPRIPARVSTYDSQATGDNITWRFSFSLSMRRAIHSLMAAQANQLDTRNVINESVVKRQSVPWKQWVRSNTKHTMNQSSRTVHALYMSSSRRFPYRSSIPNVQHPKTKINSGRTENHAEA